MTVFLASTSAAFLLLLAGLSLAGTAVAFVACMPLFVLFIPVLVPAGITVTVLASVLMAGGTSGVTAFTMFYWIYKQLTGKDHPPIPGVGAPGGAMPDGGAPGGGAADGGAPGSDASLQSMKIAKPTAKSKPKPTAKPKTKPPAKPAAKPKPKAKPAAKPKK